MRWLKKRCFTLSNADRAADFAWALSVPCTELVTPDVGFLYAPERGEEGVLEALNHFAALPREEAEAMRRAAKRRWDEGYCSASLLPKLFPGQS